MKRGHLLVDYDCASIIVIIHFYLLTVYHHNNSPEWYSGTVIKIIPKIINYTMFNRN